MTNDSSNKQNPPEQESGLPRRDFIKAAGAGAGMLLMGGANENLLIPDPSRISNVRPAAASPEIIVIGAGLWGSFTALNLRRLGAKVTIVDAYGPGNGRSTSGDETRGVRSSYGDRAGAQGETWMLWARESMTKWKDFDAEWGKQLRLNLFHQCGDMIFRPEWDNFQLRCKVWWDKNKIPYEILNPVDVRKAYPVFSIDDITAIIYEPDAGVVRARRAAQAAAAAFEALGGKIVIGRATPSKFSNGKLEEISLDTGETLRADTFVFAVGPWLGKTFPDLFAKKTRVPMGYVVYFATPIGDHRFTYPNLPTYNFPGVTGWPALPVDNRGFRVRGAERAPTPAQAATTNGPNTPVSTAGTATDTGSNLANAGRGAGAAGSANANAGGDGRGGAGRGANAAGAAGANAAGGGRGQGGGNQQQQDVPPQQQDPDTSDRWADQTRIDGSRRFVAHRFPLLKDAPVAQTHSCHYESTVTGNFIIDKHPQWSNVWISAGGNAEGAKFAPKIGDYVANRVMGKTDPVDKQFKIPDAEYPPPPPPTPADSTRARPPE
ncbi:MAG TPA: FAD-binding oxidoreductase [Gemmatimonadaceae bacterium]|jgi:glycine/D-amino acid oxidase-like deaminating enzyme